VDDSVNAAWGEPRDRVTVRLRLNDATVTAEVPARQLLADFLRHDRRLTSTTVGCEHGVCGSCTVHIDGRAARSCLMLTAQADGCEVRTLEGIGHNGKATAIQEAIARHHGVQCGFCTAGVVMTLEAADAAECSTTDDIRRLLSGNVCRCTGYQKIVDAVADAWEVHDERER
jgi:aerobic-type carbon monoxide dehydrogenase small subunit (CoxS/CutS family)